MNMSLVTFREVVKKFDRNLTVNHLSFNIGEGEIFGCLDRMEREKYGH